MTLHRLWSRRRSCSLPFARKSAIALLLMNDDERKQLSDGLWCAMLDFEAVEAFAIDSDDGALGHEGRGVDFVDELEYLGTLAPFGEDEEHLDLLATIESVGIDGGAAPSGVVVDALAYLLVFIGDDEELDAASHVVDHLVDAEGGDVEDDVAIDDAFPILEHEVAGGDDDDVADEDDSAEGYVAVLVDDGSNDVGAPRGAI